MNNLYIIPTSLSLFGTINNFKMAIKMKFSIFNRVKHSHI